MEQKFKLTNVVLYAKGWYKKSDDIFEDLKKILELDNYTSFTKTDVYSIIVDAFQKSNIYRVTELKEVLNGIHPVNCWKHNYYCKENLSWSSNNVEKENLPDYDLVTAFIYYVISNLRSLDNNHWNPQMPKVTKYPKADHVTIKSLNEHFGKIKSLT